METPALPTASCARMTALGEQFIRTVRADPSQLVRGPARAGGLLA